MAPASWRRCVRYGGQFVAGERREVIADDDALREGLVDGHGEAAPQFGLAEQEQAEAVLGVHLVVGQQAEIFEDVGAQMMRFIDDEDRADARIGAEARDFGFDLAIERGAGAFDGEAHLPGDRLVEVHDVAGRERDVDDAIEAGVQAGQDASARAGLAAAAVAGDEADAAQVEQMREADVEFARGPGEKEIVGGDLRAEGMAGEAKVFAVHDQKSSSRWRKERPEGGVVAGRVAVRVFVPWSRRTKQFA